MILVTLNAQTLYIAALTFVCTRENCLYNILLLVKHAFLFIRKYFLFLNFFLPVGARVTLVTVSTLPTGYGPSDISGGIVVTKRKIATFVRIEKGVVRGRATTCSSVC